MTTVRHPESAATAPTAPHLPSRSPGASPPPAVLRALGAGLAVGAATYGVCWLFFEGATGGGFAIDLSGIALQLGVFCLLAALWITSGTGTGRFGRGLLVVEAVVLGVATVQSAVAASAGGGEWGTVATVLDPAWPLSMLGMVVVGITVAVAGRWRGVLRVWTPIAGSWLVIGAVGMPLGPELGSIVAGAHFLVGYAALGVLLAVRPDLTRR